MRSWKRNKALKAGASKRLILPSEAYGMLSFISNLKTSNDPPAIY